MALISIIIAMKKEHPEKLVMFIPSIPTFSDLNEELSYNEIPRARGIFCLRQECVWRLFLNLLFYSITRKLYQSRLCNISILGFVHIAVRLLF